MVGSAIGLFVAATAATAVSTQLGEHRRLVLDTQLQQDLRIAADLVTRELRRAGALHDADAQRAVWQPGAAPPASAGADFAVSDRGRRVDYAYQRAPGDTTRYGFRLQGGRLQSLVDDRPQDLTDPAVMTVTAFTITPTVAPAVTLPCPRDCPDGTQACWPTVQPRGFTVEITARAAHDARVQRSVRSQARVANDLVTRPSAATAAACSE